ncbi:MAG: hypothetical protein AABW93_01285, partial [Nanoarchaeota archaeon]
NAKSFPAGNVVYVNCMPQPQQNTSEEELSWGELLSIAGGMIPGLSNKPEAQILGDAVTRWGMIEAQKEIAREGRSQVNINQGQQQQVTYAPAAGCEWANPENQSDLSVRRIFEVTNLGVTLAANSVKDFNGDGSWDFDEFIGVKTRFSADEKVNLVLYNPKKKGLSKKMVTWELYYLPTGEKVATNLWDGNLYSAVSAEYSAGGNRDRYGEYLSVFRSGEKIAKLQFTITPPPQSSQHLQSQGDNGKIHIFTSYPWIDFNKNGFVDFPQEFPAYGEEEFDSTERVLFGLYDPKGHGVQRKIKWEIYNPQGKIYASDSLETKMASVSVGQYDDLTSLLAQSGGYGTYKILWYINDIPVGSSSVKIKP